MYNGVAYNFSITLAGTAPFSFVVTAKPGWMNITISGNIIVFSGTPIDESGDVPINITISNACGRVQLSAVIPFSGVCTPVAIPGTWELPAGQVGKPYSYSIPITGSSPFALYNIAKPAWMTIAISGYTNHQNIPIVLAVPAGEVFHGNYDFDPTSGVSPFLPITSDSVYLYLPGGQLIQYAVCNGVNATISGSYAYWTNISGNLNVNFIT
jgi:hypothetical protein